MSPVPESAQPFAEWGVRTAIGFIITGMLGLIALGIRRALPVLGERLHRVYGERAFKVELQQVASTSAAVGVIQPRVEQIAEQCDRLEMRVETGFAQVDQKLDRLSDNIVLLAKAVGRVEGNAA